MRAMITPVLLAVVLATPLSAAEDVVDAAAPLPTVTEAAAADAPEAPGMHLQEVQIEERSSSADAEAAQLPARGSFWWLVGVIVVAGVILAVLV